MKHTPAPWKISTHATPKHSLQFGIYNNDSQNDFVIVRHENAAANARLISAAPELLETLCNAWNFIENVTDEDPDRTAKFFALREQVRNTLYKVTGE